MTRYFTRWPSKDEQHTEGQVRNGSVLIQRRAKAKLAEYMNGDFMGFMSSKEMPEGVAEISKQNFKLWAPACLN